MCVAKPWAATPARSRNRTRSSWAAGPVEADHKDPLGADLFYRQQVRGPVHNDPGLAGSGSGKDQHVAVAECGDDPFLGGVV